MGIQIYFLGFKDMKFFKIIVSFFLIISSAVYAADTASILPPAKTTFFDQNGKPLTSGKVLFYIPGTTTLKTTWQDAAETIANTNPVILDGAGRALILGSGSYRQIVKDRSDNVVWDQVTSSVGGGGSGGSTVGDGIAVGTISSWSGFVAPSNYAFTAGQELSRTTYSVLLSAITFTQSVTCSSGSPTINTVADTTQLNIGAAVEAACLPIGSLIVSKTSSTVTLNNNASVSTTVSATFFPHGNGNGVTTFNVPNYRGVALVGRCNMGGSACSTITSPYYTDPNSLNGAGGSQNSTLITANLPPYTPAGTNVVTNGAITNGAITVNGAASDHTPTTTGQTTAGSNAGSYGLASLTASQATTTQATTTSVFTGSAQGGISTPVSNIQPSRTINFIIKILPDINLSIARCADISDAGTACIANTGTSGHTLPYLDQINTYSAQQNFGNVSISGGTITGMPNPSAASDVANKAYVDATSTGLNILASSNLATNAVLPNTPTYSNGASGVGATLTAGSNTTLTVDSTVAILNAIVLVKNQASAFQNGIYKVTTAGSGAAAWVLTRATYFDQAAEMKAGSYTFITSGSANSNTSWTLQTAVATVGTDPSNWVQFSNNGAAASLAFGGRLTLISGQPEMQSDAVGATKIYYAPDGGQSAPIYNGSTVVSPNFTTSSTDTVGLTLDLAGDANWPVGSIHDVFITLNAGSPVLVTRAWDAGMQFTANSQLTTSTSTGSPGYITTGTGPTLWTRPSAAFDGVLAKPLASSAIVAPSNNNLDVNCLGQDWGAGNPQVLSQVLVTAPTDAALFGGIPSSLQVATYGSNDNINWLTVDVRYINASAIGVGGTATLTMNQSYTTPFRYHRYCTRGDATGIDNVYISQIRFYAYAPPAAGRRLVAYSGFQTNDAPITGRLTASTTIAVPTNQATYIGTIKIDAATTGSVTAYVNPGPSRVYNIWNMYNQIEIVAQATFPTFFVTNNLSPLVYNIASNQTWTTIQGSTYSIDVLIGYPKSRVTADLIRSVFLSGQASGYNAGIAVDTIVGGFTGTSCPLTSDNPGPQIGIQCRADLVLAPYYGSHLLTAIETLGTSSGTASLFTDIRNTRMQSRWRG